LAVVSSRRARICPSVTRLPGLTLTWVTFPLAPLAEPPPEAVAAEPPAPPALAVLCELLLAACTPEPENDRFSTLCGCTVPAAAIV
jgi:hypothetical protein